MATEDASHPLESDKPQADGPLTSEHSSGSEDDDTSSEEELVEPLYAGRERRSNQANRYSILLSQEQQAEEDDEIAALFQEDEEVDEEFPGSDAEIEAEPDEDSSDTDNEDQGPTADAGDLDGEKQLEKEERVAKKAQKRKADKVITKPAPIRKRVKIDESVSTPDLEDRKRKRSERTSWAPTIEPVRTSSRTLAVQNKERTTASLKESAAKREQAIAIQQAARKRKDAVKLRPKTQAERLAEAAETEAVNSKSLNKWQEMEQDRLKRQKARLEAMHTRKIEGPFIRWKSSRAEWTDGKVTKLGSNTMIQVVEDNHNKKLLKATTLIEPISHTPTTQASTPAPVTSAEASNPGSDQKPPGDRPPHAEPNDHPYEAPIQGPPKDGFATLMEEMEQNASKDQAHQDNPKDSSITTPTAHHQQAQPPDQATKPSDLISRPINLTKTTASAGPTEAASSTETTPPVSASALLSQFQAHAPSETTTTLRSPAPDHVRKTKDDLATRNALTLHNYSAASISHPGIERHILLHTPLPSSLSTTSTRSNRASVGRPKAATTGADQAPPKPVTALCAITGQTAKYRDPLTGLPYLNREAFAAIRRAIKGECVWSGVLGAWVGRAGESAKGVPRSFLVDEGAGGDAGGDAEAKGQV